MTPYFDPMTLWSASIALCVAAAGVVLAGRGQSRAPEVTKRAAAHLSVATIVWLLAARAGVDAQACAALAAVAVIICAIVEADARWLVIPDPLAGLLLVAVLVFPHAPSLPSSALGACVCAGLFFLVRHASRIRLGVVGLGMGDVKLAGVMGAALGLQDALAAVGVAAAATALWLVRERGRARQPDREVAGQLAAPFGVGLAITLFAGLSLRVVAENAT